MRKIAVINMKGGVGKTTTAVHLAARLAHLGRRVLLIDADPQGNVGYALAVRPVHTLADLLLGTATPEETILKEIRPGLDVLPSTPAGFLLETHLRDERRETVLASRLRDLAGYDAVVVDTSPAMGLLTYNALLYATEIIVPIAMDWMSVIAARQTLRGIREIRTLWPEHPLDIVAVLPTMINQATTATRATLAALEHDAELAGHVYWPGIRQCLDLTYATSRRQTIWEYAARSRAAEDYDTFVRFVESRMETPQEAAAGA